MNPATMMNPMAMMPTPAQGAYMPFVPATPAPQQATSSQASVPNLFDLSAWMKMFPNSIPPATGASPAPALAAEPSPAPAGPAGPEVAPAPALAAEPGPAAPEVAPKKVKKTHHRRPHHQAKKMPDKPAETK
jgi:hypothetical protein